MKGVYIFLGTVVIAGTAYWLYNNSKRPSNENDVVMPVDQLDYNKLLKYGVRGNEVLELQRRLGGLAVDGIFGPKTQARLKAVKGVLEITLNQI